jgi:ABC-type phosphate transport system substrate-binding protein
MKTTMTKSLVVLAAWVGLMLASPRVAQAQDGFKVIVNSANPVGSLKAAEVSKLFLRKQTKWTNGRIVQPVDQSESASARRKFSQAVHGMDVPSVKSFWQEVVFAGRGEPPLEKPSDTDVVAYVKANPNAIGYVSPEAPVADVKVLSVRP